MQCPHCEAVMPEDDLFCEECGQPLKNPNAPVCLCGAPEGDLDDDGYCLQCGRRCRPAPGDHEEYEVSADFAAVTDRGRQHHRNEDRCSIADGESKILIVCDGVSSSIDAQAASQAAADAICEALVVGAELAAAMEDAAKAVSQLGTADMDTAPSTTVVAAVVRERQVRLGWLGDSRAYWIAESESKQLTTDHSWLNDAVASGEMTYEEAVNSPRSHAITRWLGADADACMRPEFSEFDVPCRGYLLVCSDGLWNYAPTPAELAELISAARDEAAVETARRLVSFANEKGGHDNISVALLRFAD